MRSFMSDVEQIVALESLPDVIALIASKKKQGHKYLGCFVEEPDIGFNAPDPIDALERRVRKESGSMLCLDHRHGAVFLFEEPGVFAKGSKSGWATQT